MADYTELVKALRDDNACTSVKTLHEAADAIEELQQTVEHYKGCADDWYKEACDYKAIAPEWIPVTERLPKEWENVLAYQSAPDGNGLIRDAVYIGSGMWREAEMHTMLSLPVTHWMPLPEPPKEEQTFFESLKTGLEQAVNGEYRTETVAKEEQTDPCADCRHYPPSSTDGKPCCICDPFNPLTNCREAKEEQT